MKNRFVAMLCATTMAFSALGGMSIANVSAAENPAVNATAEYNPETKEAAITLSYSGFDNIAVFQAKVPVDTDVFEVPATDTFGKVTDIAPAEGFKNVSAWGEETKLVSYVFAPSDPSEYVLKGDGDVFTLTLKVKDDSKLPASIQLEQIIINNMTNLETGAYTSYGTADTKPQETLVVAPVEIVNPNAPTERPTFDTTGGKPTMAPTAAPTEDATEQPTDEPTPVPDTNVTGTATYDAKTKEAKINVSYSGLHNIAVFQIKVPVDTDVFEVPATDTFGKVTNIAPAEGFKNVSAWGEETKLVSYVFAPSDPSEYVLKGEGDVFTLTLKVKDESKLPKTIAFEQLIINDMTDLETGAYTSYGTEDTKPQQIIAVVNPVVSLPAVATPEPTEKPTEAPKVGTIALKDAISAEAQEEIKTTENDITIEVTIEGKDDAQYGVDYVACYDGKELTADELSNMLNGYGSAMSDVVENLVFEIYNNAITGITATVKDWTKGEIVDSGNTEMVPATTPKPTAKPTSTPKPTKKPTDNTGSSNTSNNGGAGGNIARPGIGGTTNTVTTTNFQDLGSVPWAAAQINTLANLGILNGYSSTEFGPNGIVTRAEFTKMVCAAFTITPDSSLAQKFTDVSPSDWFYGYVMAASNKGVVLGISDTAFDPNRTINRQEMAAILYRAINASNMVMPSGTPKVFADASTIAEYAVPSVNALSAAGIIDGVSSTTFAPLEPATRAQAACIIYKYYQAVGAL